MKAAEGYRVELSTAAKRELKKLPREAHRRVIERLERLGDNARPAGSVKISGEEDLFRARVGDYRVVYLVLDRERAVVVARIAHRKDVYRKTQRLPS